MAPVTKYSKENILDVSYKILRKDGMESVNARRIAKELKSSVQPIFSNFVSMEDLKKQLVVKATEEFYKYIMTSFDDKMSKYKQSGINYIRFAKEEPKLFHLLFAQETSFLKNYDVSPNNYFNRYCKIIEEDTKLASEKIKDFHLKMWIFTHGLAMLLASDSNAFSLEEISKLLTEEFQALIQLEQES